MRKIPHSRSEHSARGSGGASGSPGKSKIKRGLSEQGAGNRTISRRIRASRLAKGSSFAHSGRSLLGRTRIIGRLNNRSQAL